MHHASKQKLTVKPGGSMNREHMTAAKTKREEMVGVRLTPDERTMLEGLATKYGETPAGMLRRLMHNAIRAQSRRKSAPDA